MYPLSYCVRVLLYLAVFALPHRLAARLWIAGVVLWSLLSVPICNSVSNLVRELVFRRAWFATQLFGVFLSAVLYRG